MKKALIAMSGGVDSSVAAAKMVEAGYDCLGVTMRLHDGDNCGAAKEAEDAKKIADTLGFPFEIADLRETFSRQVMDRFVSAYEAGDTPNPCIECNRHMKFGALMEMAKNEGCDLLVTGHYARVEYDSGKYRLKKAVNLAKDQTYVLYFLTQEQLAHIAFPLGEMESKEQIRGIAED